MSRNAVSLEQLVLVSVGLFRGDTLADTRFKYVALRRLLGTLGDSDEILDRWQVLAAVEDEAGFRSNSEIWGLIESMRILEAVRGGYRLKSTLTLADLFGGGVILDQPGIGIDFLDSFEGRLQERPSVGLLSIATMVRAARQAMLPLADTTRDRGLPAPTTFWERDADTGALVPWGNNPSTFTAVDILLQIAEPWLLFPDISPFDAACEECRRTAVGIDLCLTLFDGPDHPRPGVCYVPEDDDYPGAQLPTVPSNGALLRGLAVETEWRRRLGLEPRVGLADTAQSLAEFLIKMQLPAGGWGVYRYPDGSGIDVPPSTVLTGIAVRGLIAARVLVPEAVRAAIAESLSRVSAFLDATRQADPAGWARDFDPIQGYELYDTLEAALTRLDLARALNEPAPDLSDVFRQAEAAWVVHPDAARNIHEVTMRPPQRDRPSITKVTWEQPGHAKAVSQLVAACLDHGYRLKPETWRRVEDAVALIATGCQDGCWEDFNLKGKIFPSNMVYFVDALCRYAQAVRHFGMTDPAA
ncbi:hypothetical protein [Azospirillum griseum]|uniref:Uncharacterized protein n=1 Tax=Azospirillum griseum TaxID=2496639 RepID=A0A3S0K790_9PROT|nr:hypothetical protein [Azospirillum griseum]RTR13449.1 hypothetical protein EJ903_24665 [Azospirillum griseum]